MASNNLLVLFTVDKLGKSAPIVINTEAYINGLQSTEACIYSEIPGLPTYNRIVKYFTFDAKGNWTTQWQFDSADTINPVIIKERTYIYYTD